MKIKSTISILTTILILGKMQLKAQSPIYQSPAYSIYADKVVQGDYTAKAVSPIKITSNYKSPANLFMSGDVNFKFSINGRDNENVPGMDHVFSTADGGAKTPVIKFGQRLNAPANKQTFMQPSTAVNFRVDMNEVLKSFATKGFYQTFNGEKIFKEEFKGVWIAGSSAPLNWDFDNLAKNEQFKLNDDDKDGIFETTIIFNKPSDANVTDDEWVLHNEISSYPTMQSSYPISDAIYNMSLDEMLKAIESDSTFRTGKEWGGVWTRDISYSIILSMAYMQPRVAMKSLMRKVNAKGKIIQDTGTGGAWPVSSDRAVWTIAAYEIYKATGDTNWLRTTYEIAKNSMEDDLKTGYDAATGLFRGESSFLDWREQTYPKWMQPADIYESKCLGTNAVFYQANTLLAEMAVELNEPENAAKFKSIAGNVKNGINKHLWMEDKGYYAQYLYGRNYQTISPKAEALGEALCVLWGVADSARSQRILASVPQTEFGISCIYPQIPGILPYHNNGVWPFVQGYWLRANAKYGNEKGVMESIAAIYRAAALFATNKENFVAQDGDFKGTQMNSSIMLWSISANIGLVHKVLFGTHLENVGFGFKPVVPKELAGERVLKNFRYKNCVLDIYVKGYGNQIKSFKIDGKQQYFTAIHEGTQGRLSIEIELMEVPSNATINKVANKFAPEMPKANYENNILSWSAVPNATLYKVLVNGELKATTEKNHYQPTERNLAEYSIIAVDKDGLESFMTEPIAINQKPIVLEAEAYNSASTKPYRGFTGKGFVETSVDSKVPISFEVDVQQKGYYFIDFRYSNGSGPLNTENKCGIRSLFVDDKENGVVLFPQRGKDEWSIWGFTNALKVYLTPGKHTLQLKLEPHNNNMNIEVNTAAIDHLRLVPIIVNK